MRAGSLASAHDIAEGGLLVAVAECCLAGGRGAALIVHSDTDPLVTLFGEGAGAFVVSGERAVLDGLGARVIGGTTGGHTLSVASGDATFAAGLGELREAHGSLAALFP